MFIRSWFFIVLLGYCCMTNLILALNYRDDDIDKATSLVPSAYEIIPSDDYAKDAIYRHVAQVLSKRASKKKTSSVSLSPELSTLIVAQIRARIHTQITTKISASIYQKVNASLSIKASVMGGTVEVKDAQLSAIQSAAVDGIKTKIGKTVDQKLDKILSETIGPAIDKQLPTNQKTISTSKLNNVLISAETLLRTELKVALPEVQKSVKKSINTQFNTQIKDLEVDIPGVLRIQISANLNVTSSVKASIERVYKSYANVSVAVAVKSYIKGITS